MQNAGALRERTRLMYAVIDAARQTRQARRTADGKLIEQRLTAQDKAVDRLDRGPGGPDCPAPRDVRVWEPRGRSSDV
jgi:hypothetical protein